MSSSLKARKRSPRKTRKASSARTFPRLDLTLIVQPAAVVLHGEWVLEATAESSDCSEDPEVLEFEDVDPRTYEAKEPDPADLREAVQWDRVCAEGEEACFETTNRFYRDDSVPHWYQWRDDVNLPEAKPAP